MVLTLNNQVVALITYYQGYTEVVFTGIKGYNSKVSIKVSKAVSLTKDKLELLAQAVA